MHRCIYYTHHTARQLRDTDCSPTCGLIPVRYTVVTATHTTQPGSWKQKSQNNCKNNFSFLNDAVTYLLMPCKHECITCFHAEFQLKQTCSVIVNVVWYSHWCAYPAMCWKVHLHIQWCTLYTHCWHSNTAAGHQSLASFPDNKQILLKRIIQQWRLTHHGGRLPSSRNFNSHRVLFTDFRILIAMSKDNLQQDSRHTLQTTSHLTKSLIRLEWGGKKYTHHQSVNSLMVIGLVYFWRCNLWYSVHNLENTASEYSNKTNKKLNPWHSGSTNQSDLKFALCQYF